MSETKLIRTSQMSVHGYPAGMSVFDCNLKLGLLRSRRDSWQCGTSHAEEDDVSLAGVLQDAVGRAVCCLFAVFER